MNSSGFSSANMFSFQPVTEYPDGIFAIDTGYVRPYLDAVFVLIEKGRAAIIDAGTNHSVAEVLKTLDAQRIAPEAVDYVILTHVHLDHAGGAGQLMTKLPNARLVVHPRGARHMIDPAQLIAGTIAVYGEAKTASMHGQIVPVAKERVMIVHDGDRIDVAGRPLVFYDTPGHARHHHCVHDVNTDSIFCGDMFGLSYRELDRDGHAFVFPATTPTQFDPIAFHASIERLMTLLPKAAYVTHYGRVTDLVRLAADLLRLVDAHAAIANRVPGGAANTQAFEMMCADIEQLVRREAAEQPWGLDIEQSVALMKMDIGLNAQGLITWLQTRKNL